MLDNLTPLTPKNYYSHETDFEYLSFSIFKKFVTCEAETLAELKGEYQPERKSTALLVGNYVHSYFESPEAHLNFIKVHRNEMMTAKAKLTADFKKAEKYIATLDNDALFNEWYKPGKKEVIVTGEIDGVPWKGKIDSLMLEKGYFCDLKTVNHLHKKQWSDKEGGWTNFIFNREYHLQMAIYQELIRQTFGQACQPVIFAVSKEEVPDKMAISFESDYVQAKMTAALEEVKAKQAHFVQVLNGEAKPDNCGLCDYCKLHKQLNSFVDADAITLN